MCVLHNASAGVFFLSTFLIFNSISLPPSYSSPNAASQVIKCTGKYTPIPGFLHFGCPEVLPAADAVPTAAECVIRFALRLVDWSLLVHAHAHNKIQFMFFYNFLTRHSSVARPSSTATTSWPLCSGGRFANSCPT